MWRGWRVHAERPARTSKGWRTPVQGDPGFFDLVLARRGRVIFAELKSARGKLSAEQEAWLAELSGGPERYTWRPADFPAIEATLA